EPRPAHFIPPSADRWSIPITKAARSVPRGSKDGQSARQPCRDLRLAAPAFVACFLESRNAVEPRLCRLQLRGKRQQGRFFAVAAREMYTDRQIIRRPVQRHVH